MNRLSLLAGAIALALLLPVNASAQVFGTFTWQMQPYCNQITLTLKNTTAGFTLDGTDDQCGVSRGSAYGVATFTPTGTVALNFTIVPAPSGKAIHVSAVVDPGTGSGAWNDSAGRTGTFSLGTATGGAARPDPTSTLGAGAVSTTTLADGAVTTAKLAAGAVTSAKVDSSQVQLRVSNSCAAGQLMIGVNANGTVLCAAPTRPAANLECLTTGTPTSFSLAANSTNFFNNPACPAGYTAVTPYCWTSSAGVYSQGSGYNANVASNATFCSWQNTTGASQPVFGGNLCCRVPAQ